MNVVWYERTVSDMQENTGDTYGTPAVKHPQFSISVKMALTRLVLRYHTDRQKNLDGLKLY